VRLDQLWVSEEQASKSGSRFAAAAGTKVFDDGEEVSASGKVEEEEVSRRHAFRKLAY
jgi:hypothetical protein